MRIYFKNSDRREKSERKGTAVEFFCFFSVSKLVRIPTEAWVVVNSWLYWVVALSETERFRSLTQTEFLAGVRLTAFMMLLSQAMLASSMYSAIASCADVWARAVASRQLFKPRGVVSSCGGGAVPLWSDEFELAFAAAAACSAFRAARFGSPVLQQQIPLSIDNKF